ncbi:MAG: hypothetical protein IIC21_02745 [Chloroflexi bacterium]|nr:hypothetical protein [Chloroflexota bacterium]
MRSPPARGLILAEAPAVGVPRGEQTAGALAEHVQGPRAVQIDAVGPAEVPAVQGAAKAPRAQIDDGHGVPAGAFVLGQRHAEMANEGMAVAGAEHELVGIGIQRHPRQFLPAFQVVIPQRMIALLHDDERLFSGHGVFQIVMVFSKS